MTHAAAVLPWGNVRQTGKKQAPPVARAALTSALIGTGLIALGAFWLSFTALTDLARKAGVPAGQAWAWPLILDGIIVVATVAVVGLVGHGGRVSAYPWILLLTSAGISIVANVAHALVIPDPAVPAVVSAGVAAVPPATLVAATHLSAVLLNRSERKPRARALPPGVSVETTTPVSAPRPTRERHATRPLDELPAWFAEQSAAGRELTGRDVADEFGVSTATGRRRLAKLRQADPVTS